MNLEYLLALKSKELICFLKFCFSDLIISNRHRSEVFVFKKLLLTRLEQLSMKINKDSSRL